MLWLRCLYEYLSQAVHHYESGQERFFYPQIDTNLCIHCNLCENVCPIINETDSIRPIMVEAVKSKSDKDVKVSSSGAVCYELSRYFINNGGVVYGAAWTDDLTVKHIRVTDNADLEKSDAVNICKAK